MTKANILFIAIDDQNDWVGCLGGHPQIRTPHIDRLANRGTTFTNAHCQAPICNPSRTSLMTGLRPSTTGIYGLAPWFRDVESWSKVVSLPQYLGQHGYRTYSAGKIYHGRAGRRPRDNEFDVLGPLASVGARPKQKLVDTPSKHPLVDWGVFPHQDRDKGDWKVAQWGVQQLDDDPPEPFFPSLGFFLPHVPCYATQKWFDLYPEDTLKLPPAQLDDRADTPRFSWYLHWSLPEPRLKFLREADQWRNLVRSASVIRWSRQDQKKGDCTLTHIPINDILLLLLLLFLLLLLLLLLHSTSYGSRTWRRTCTPRSRRACGPYYDQGRAVLYGMHELRGQFGGPGRGRPGP